MNVKELKESLAGMPDYFPVYVLRTTTSEYDGSIRTDHLRTLDCQSGNFPTQGNMAVIRLESA